MNFQFINTIFIVTSLCVVNNTQAMDLNSVQQKIVPLKGIGSCFNDLIGEVNNIIEDVKSLDENIEINRKLLSDKLKDDNSNSLSDNQKIVLDLLFGNEDNKYERESLLKTLEDIISYCLEMSEKVTHALAKNMISLFCGPSKVLNFSFNSKNDSIIKSLKIQISSKEKKYNVIRKINNILEDKIKDIALEINNSKNKDSLKNMIMRFQNSINSYNLVSLDYNIINDMHSGAEQFFHKLYLDYLSSEYMCYSHNNCAYATVSMNCSNNDNKSDERNSTIMISSTEYYEKSTKIFEKTHNNGKIEINNYENCINKYDSNELILFDDFNGQYNDIMTYLCKKYLLVDGRGVVKDDEFQILYYLFRNTDKIIKTLLSNSKNEIKDITLDVKLFTYMDMCPSCWTAWNECYNELKMKYKNCILSNINKNEKLDKLNFNLNVNVYSIKPYIISREHPFIKNIAIENTDNDNLNINDTNNWCKPELRNKIRQRIIKLKDLKNKDIEYYCPIKQSVRQIVDSEGLNMMRKYRNNREQFTKHETQKDISCVVW